MKAASSQPQSASLGTRQRARTKCPRLSIIVIGYQGAELIAPCLASIQKHCAVDCEVILVDNASSDGTIAAAREALPGIQITEMGRNAGYGSAANVGVAQAKGEYCLLLNQDLELETDVEAALQRLEFDPGLALIGCQLRFPDGRTQFGLGREHTPWRMVASWLVPLGVPFLGPLLARVETRPELYGKPQGNLDWVSGAFLAFRRADWLQVGGMDEDFFLYVEDVELARRFRDSGKRIGYEPTIRVCHHEAAGKQWPGTSALACTFDGYLRLLQKHASPQQVGLTRAGLFAACLWRAGLHAALALGLRVAQVFSAGRAAAWRLQEEKACAFLAVGRNLL